MPILKAASGLLTLISTAAMVRIFATIISKLLALVT